MNYQKIATRGQFGQNSPKKTVKIGYFYINHGKLFFIFAKVSSFLPPIFGKKICIFCCILQKLVKNRQTKNISQQNEKFECFRCFFIRCLSQKFQLGKSYDCSNTHTAMHDGENGRFFICSESPKVSLDFQFVFYKFKTKIKIERRSTKS
jgi:hypothetical protein